MCFDFRRLACLFSTTCRHPDKPDKPSRKRDFALPYRFEYLPVAFSAFPRQYNNNHQYWYIIYICIYIHKVFFCFQGKEAWPKTKNSPDEKSKKGDAATVSNINNFPGNPSISYLHALVAVTLGSFMSSAEGLTRGTLSAGINKHVRKVVWG